MIMSGKTITPDVVVEKANPCYLPLMNTLKGGKDEGIEAFLIDVQTRVWKNIEQSGFELFVQTFDGTFLKFFIPFDPYFYVIVSEWEKNHVKVKRHVMTRCLDDQGKSLVKDLNAVTKHVWGSWGDVFVMPQRVLKVTLFYPSDVTACRKEVERLEIVEWREADVPFHIRGMIDLDLNVGKAYRFKVQDGFVYEYTKLEVNHLPDIPDKCTFDIEIKKAPIKKPKIGDPINMFGYKHGKRGFIMNNLAIHKVPIKGFWFGVKNGKACPITEDEATVMKKRGKYKPVYFDAINLVNEREVIQHWRDFLGREQPKVLGGYNSDFFDWKQIIENGKLQRPPVDFEGYFKYDTFEEAWNRDGHIVIDAIDYIQRDSYLSKGNQGLKDVSQILLGIEPLEVDHEEMVRLVSSLEHLAKPNDPGYNLGAAIKIVQDFAHYCASDVYITSILFEEHVVDLDFSLSTIIPLTVFESARKARGQMVEAMLLKLLHDLGMVAPNKVNFHGKKYFNPGDELKKGIDVYQEVTVQGEDVWARCIDKRWMIDNCKGCEHLSACKKDFVDPIIKNKKIECKKNGGYVILTPKSDLPVMAYKFEGAYVDVFQIGVFKDNCPVKFSMNIDRLGEIEKKMKAVVLRKITGLIDEGATGIESKALFNDIHAGFERVMRKCSVQQGDDGMMYYGLINLVHIDVASMYPSLIINYNLQPHGIVNELMCSACPVRYDETNGEAPCWVELDWNAVYDVVLIPSNLKESIDNHTKEKIPADKLAGHYKELLSKAVKEEKIPRPRRQGATYKRPQVARFCQKAHKTFVKMVSDFREERYKYKTAMKNTDKAIGRIRDQWKEQMPAILLQRTMECQSRIGKLERDIERYLVATNSGMEIEITETDFKQIVTESISLKNAITKIVEEWMGEIPEEIRNELNKLEIKKIYNRNAQLTYKVILNAIYGWLKSAGARLWSIEVTGCTTLSGQKVIQWVVDYTKGFTMPIELDSLDYQERIVLKDPDGLIQIMSIGKFVDNCFDENDVEMIDDHRKVEYTKAPNGWEVLSVNDKGIVEWQMVKRGIRQETDRDIVEVTTPFGKIKVTDSHSLFHNNFGLIEPIEIKNVEKEFITHACYIPPVEKEKIMVNLTKPFDDVELLVFVPKETGNKWKEYPLSKLRPTKRSKAREYYYKIPANEFTGEIEEGTLVGTLRGSKFNARIPMTEELAELCGWYVSEGSSVKRWRDSMVEFDVGIAQKRGGNLNRIKELVSIAGSHVKNYVAKSILIDKSTKTYRIGISNLFFYQLFRVLGCGKTSLEKRIPPLILSAPANIKKAFLKGYFKGDGSVQEKGVALYTFSDGLRDDLFVFGKMMGYIVSMYKDYSRIRGKPFYIVNFMKRSEWEMGSKSHYSHNKIGETIGLQIKEMKSCQKSNNYVYDISVNKNNNFVCANGGILAHNTDGEWGGIPVDLPLEIIIKYKDKHGIEREMGVNLFNSVVNHDVQIEFTNRNNYEWNDESQEYMSVPRCMIEFEYDGPYSTLFVQRMKRYTAKERDEDDPTKQNVSEIKGMDQKRKGELEMIKRVEIGVDKVYEEAGTYDEVYGGAIDVVNRYVSMIVNREMPPTMIYEARDMKSVDTVKKAYAIVREAELKKLYDPEEVPMCADIINEHVESKGVKAPPKTSRMNSLGNIAAMIGSKNKSMSNRQSMGCLRMIDLGIDVNDGETVQWFVSKYPIAGGIKMTWNDELHDFEWNEHVKAVPISVSQRAIPTILFDADDETIRKYLKRWIGIDLPARFDKKMVMSSIIDWKYYLDRLGNKVFNIVINPFEHQKNMVSKEIARKMEKLKIMLGYAKKEKIKPKGIDFFMTGPTEPERESLEEKSKMAATTMKLALTKKKKKIDMLDFL